MNMDEQHEELMRIVYGPKYRPPQDGPIRYIDRQGICACGSPAYVTVEGDARCLKHALDDAIEMLAKLTRQRANDSNAEHGTRWRYAAGCRCSYCKRANSAYMAEYRDQTTN